MRRRRLIGRLLALLAPPLRLRQRCSFSGPGQRAVDAHRLRGSTGFCCHPQHRSGVPSPTGGGLTCVTIPLMSPVLLGNRMVLDSLARCEKAETYCSATLSDAAAFPFCGRQKRTFLSATVDPGTWSRSSGSPGWTEHPTGPGSPSTWPLLWPRPPGPHLRGRSHPETNFKGWIKATERDSPQGGRGTGTHPGPG